MGKAALELAKEEMDGAGVFDEIARVGSDLGELETIAVGGRERVFELVGVGQEFWGDVSHFWFVGWDLGVIEVLLEGC